MSQLIKTACVAAGLVVAGFAATSAQAAQPLNVKQKAELARDMERPHAAKAAPRKVAKAKSASAVSAGGDDTSVVPEELYNYLTATPDAHGRMRVRDTDATAPAPAAVEATDEK